MCICIYTCLCFVFCVFLVLVTSTSIEGLILPYRWIKSTDSFLFFFYFLNVWGVGVSREPNHKKGITKNLDRIVVSSKFRVFLCLYRQKYTSESTSDLYSTSSSLPPFFSFSSITLTHIHTHTSTPVKQNRRKNKKSMCI